MGLLSQVPVRKRKTIQKGHINEFKGLHTVVYMVYLSILGIASVLDNSAHHDLRTLPMPSPQSSQTLIELLTCADIVESKNLKCCQHADQSNSRSQVSFIYIALNPKSHFKLGQQCLYVASFVHNDIGMLKY